MRKFIGAIDVGTSGVRFVIFDRDATVVASAHEEVPLSYPQSGWVEQDPMALVSATVNTMRTTLRRGGISPTSLMAIGMANQRETTILWNRTTGTPVYPAIVWQDRRTARLCGELQATELGDEITEQTGLPIDPYFSATKIEWLFRNIPGVSEHAAAGEILIGTVDAWLLWSLTGRHATDTTNASRTLLFSLRNESFDPELLTVFGIPAACLPAVEPSLSVFANMRPDILGPEIPVAGILGDQQAALFGHAAFESGQAKVTWGTGAFLLTNTGHDQVRSKHRLISTVAYSALRGQTHYALEGSVFAAGAAIQWLRDGLGIIGNASETSAIAHRVTSTDGLYFVPALAGLGAPYWDPTARGLLVGITHGTRREHVVRATLEAIAYQTYDVVRSMERDLGRDLTQLHVDGGAAENDFLCQFQSDLLGIPVVRPSILEVTALGAAFAAGLSSGFWDGFGTLCDLTREERRFEPTMNQGSREQLLSKWQVAVDRSRNWEKVT